MFVRQHSVGFDLSATQKPGSACSIHRLLVLTCVRPTNDCLRTDTCCQDVSGRQQSLTDSRVCQCYIRTAVPFKPVKPSRPCLSHYCRCSMIDTTLPSMRANSPTKHACTATALQSSLRHLLCQCNASLNMARKLLPGQQHMLQTNYDPPAATDACRHNTSVNLYSRNAVSCSRPGQGWMYLNEPAKWAPQQRSKQVQPSQAKTQRGWW